MVLFKTSNTSNSVCPYILNNWVLHHWKCNMFFKVFLCRGAKYGCREWEFIQWFITTDWPYKILLIKLLGWKLSACSILWYSWGCIFVRQTGCNSTSPPYIYLWLKITFSKHNYGKWDSAPMNPDWMGVQPLSSCCCEWCSRLARLLLAESCWFIGEVPRLASRSWNQYVGIVDCMSKKTGQLVTDPGKSVCPNLHKQKTQTFLWDLSWFQMM